MSEETRIDCIGNYYGGFWIRAYEGAYYWGVEDYDGTKWKEISEKLYHELLRYEQQRPKDNDTEDD